MTFKEAKDKKKSMNLEEYTNKGMVFHVFITPEKPDDFIDYLSKVRGYFNHLKDEDSKLFSRNDCYLVRGLFFDGANIVHKTL